MAEMERCVFISIQGGFKSLICLFQGARIGKRFWNANSRSSRERTGRSVIAHLEFLSSHHDSLSTRTRQHSISRRARPPRLEAASCDQATQHPSSSHKQKVQQLVLGETQTLMRQLYLLFSTLLTRLVWDRMLRVELTRPPRPDRIIRRCRHKR